MRSQRRNHKHSKASRLNGLDAKERFSIQSKVKTADSSEMEPKGDEAVYTAAQIP
jgi:hypothetical protein